MSGQSVNQRKSMTLNQFNSIIRGKLNTSTVNNVIHTIDNMMFLYYSSGSNTERHMASNAYNPERYPQNKPGEKELLQRIAD